MEAKATKIMPLYCFQVLEHSLNGLKPPEAPADIGQEPSYVRKLRFFVFAKCGIDLSFSHLDEIFLLHGIQ